MAEYFLSSTPNNASVIDTYASDIDMKFHISAINLYVFIHVKATLT
jgi:hypothetical protein